MQENTFNKYGLLLNSNIKLHRRYFKEMTKLLGINCRYYAPKTSPVFDTYGDLATNFCVPEIVGCIFQDHPDQKMLKKMGWVTELQESSSIIHVPFDLPELQVGALFELPPAIDGAPWRLFRVISLQSIMVYPASIACEIAPEFKNKSEKTVITDFSKSTGNILIDNEEDD